MDAFIHTANQTREEKLNNFLHPYFQVLRCVPLMNHIHRGRSYALLLELLHEKTLFKGLAEKRGC